MPKIFSQPRRKAFVYSFLLLALSACSNEMTIGFSSPEQEVSERAIEVKIPVHLGRSSRTGLAVPYLPIQNNSKTIRVPYTVSGTAVNPDNHNLADGFITVPPGSISTDLIFRLVPGTFEPPKTIVVTMGTSEDATLEATNVHTVTVTTQAPAPMSFASSSIDISEGVGTASIPVHLEYETYHQVTVPYTVSGTATNPADHSLADGTLTFDPGVRVANITFPVVDDSIFEGNETVIITLGTPSSYAAAGNIMATTVNIVENDGPPVVNFGLANQTVSEPIGTVNLAVNINQIAAVDTVVTYTVSGTATITDDYTLGSPGSVTITAGQTTVNLPILVVDDALTESNETVIIDMGTVTNGQTGTATQYRLTIVDDESAPIVNFDMGSRTVTEGVGSLTLDVELNHGTAFPVDVPYTVTGTASNPADHNLSSGTITVPAGQTTANVSFNVVNDSMDENDETIIATMGVPTNAGPGPTTVQTTTITDNDSPPSADFTTSTQNVSEGVGSVTVTMTLTAASSFDVTVPYTISGSAANPADHNLGAGSFFIAAGGTSANVNFSVVNDSLYEGDETVVVTMGTPTNANTGVSVQTITITDNDTPPVVNFASASQTVLENIGTASVTVNLSVASGLSTTVPYSVTGTAANPADHNLGGSNLVIPAGQTSGNITFSVVSDTRDENDETVILTMGSPTNGTKGSTDVHTLTIQDDDPRPTLNFSASSQSVAETAGTVFVIVVLSAASSFDVSMPFTVGGTAVNPTNHNLTAGTINISAGNTLGQQTFTVFNDGVATGNLNVVLTQGTPTNADAGSTTVHTVTILDAGREFDKRGLERWFSADRGIGKRRDGLVTRWDPVNSEKAKPLEWAKGKKPTWSLPFNSVWPQVELPAPWSEALNFWVPPRRTSNRRVYWVIQGARGVEIFFKDLNRSGAGLFSSESKPEAILEWMLFDRDERQSGFQDVENYLRERYSITGIEAGR